MIKTYEKYKDQGFRVVSISTEEPEKLMEFARQKGATHPLLSDPTGRISQLYQAESIPANYYLDAQGKLVEATVGFDPVDGPSHMDKLARTMVDEMKKS